MTLAHAIQNLRPWTVVCRTPGTTTTMRILICRREHACGNPPMASRSRATPRPAELLRQPRARHGQDPVGPSATCERQRPQVAGVSGDFWRDPPDEVLDCDNRGTPRARRRGGTMAESIPDMAPREHTLLSSLPCASNPRNGGSEAHPNAASFTARRLVPSIS